MSIVQQRISFKDLPRPPTLGIAYGNDLTTSNTVAGIAIAEYSSCLSLLLSSAVGSVPLANRCVQSSKP